MGFRVQVPFLRFVRPLFWGFVHRFLVFQVFFGVLAAPGLRGRFLLRTYFLSNFRLVVMVFGFPVTTFLLIIMVYLYLSRFIFVGLLRAFLRRMLVDAQPEGVGIQVLFFVLIVRFPVVIVSIHFYHIFFR